MIDRLTDRLSSAIDDRIEQLIKDDPNNKNHIEWMYSSIYIDAQSELYSIIIDYCHTNNMTLYSSMMACDDMMVPLISAQCSTLVDIQQLEWRWQSLG